MTVGADRSEVPSYATMGRLDGRALVVVGAGRGIGRQTAHALSQAGAHVVCADLDLTRAVSVSDEIGGTPWCGDARQRASAEELLQFVIDRHGSVSGLVDIVGQSTYEDFLTMTDELWDNDFSVNLRHAFVLSGVFGSHMSSAGGGTMVFVSSIAGLTSSVGHAAYGAAKAGLVNLVKTVAEELGPRGVRVNSIAPGAIATPRMEATLPDRQKERSALTAPLRRMGLPSDIAAAALFLSSDLSSFVTGQTILVDGGVSIKFPFPIDF